MILKRIKLFEDFETDYATAGVGILHKNGGAKLRAIEKDVIRIANSIEGLDTGPEWDNKFISALEKAGFEVFTGDALKDYTPKQMDIIMGIEGFAGDGDFSVFMNNQVEAPENEYTWDEYYEKFGPDEFEEDSIIVARKK